MEKQPELSPAAAPAPVCHLLSTSLTSAVSLSLIAFLIPRSSDGQIRLAPVLQPKLLWMGYFGCCYPVANVANVAPILPNIWSIVNRREN